LVNVDLVVMWYSSMSLKIPSIVFKPIVFMDCHPHHQCFSKTTIFILSTRTNSLLFSFFLLISLFIDKCGMMCRMCSSGHISYLIGQYIHSLSHIKKLHSFSHLITHPTARSFGIRVQTAKNTFVFQLCFHFPWKQIILSWNRLHYSLFFDRDLSHHILFLLFFPFFAKTSSQ